MCKNIPKHGPCCVTGPKPNGGCHCCGPSDICTDKGCRPSCKATCKGDGKGGVPCCKGEECQICDPGTQECSPTNGCQTKEVCQSDSSCDSWCKSLGVGGGCCKKTQRFNPGLCSCCHHGETCNSPSANKQLRNVSLQRDEGEGKETSLNLADDRGWGGGTTTGYGWGACNCDRPLCEAHCGQYGKKGCCTRLPVRLAGSDLHDFCVCCDDGANCNMGAMRCEDNCWGVGCTNPGENCVNGKCVCDAKLCQSIDKCHTCGLSNTCDKIDCGACAVCDPNNGCLSLCNPATENCVGGTCKDKCGEVVCPMGSKCVGGLCQCDRALCGVGDKCQFCGSSGTCETKSCPASTPCDPNSGDCLCTDSACSAQCDGVPCCSTDLKECQCCPTGWNCASPGGWGRRDNFAGGNSSRAGVCTDPCSGVICPIPGDSCQNGVCKCDLKSCGKNNPCEACGSTGHCGPIECGECAKCEPETGCVFQCDRATQICNNNTCQCDATLCQNIDQCHSCGLLNTCDKIDCGPCFTCVPIAGCTNQCNPATESCVNGSCKDKCDGVICTTGNTCTAGVCQCNPTTCGQTCDGKCNPESQICESGCPGKCNVDGECPQSCEMGDDDACWDDCRSSGFSDGCCLNATCQCCDGKTFAIECTTPIWNSILC